MQSQAGNTSVRASVGYFLSFFKKKSAGKVIDAPKVKEKIEETTGGRGKKHRGKGDTVLYDVVENAENGDELSH
jgi:hypothetical protein